MRKEIDLLSKHFFQSRTLGQLQEAEIETLVAEYPYLAPLHVLLACKKHASGDSQGQETAITASLYLNNPLRLPAILEHSAATPETEIKTQLRTGEEAASAPTIPAPPAKPDDFPIVFQSYHTIDYFASQGIRLQQADLTKDKFGQQLKSFTEWLRSMKKLPNPEQGGPSSGDSDPHQQEVIRSAHTSIEDKEVLTETMAEVWAKQGNTQNAIAVYNKLSLLNPAKSAYFAAKIDELKAV